MTVLSFQETSRAEIGWRLRWGSIHRVLKSETSFLSVKTSNFVARGIWNFTAIRLTGGFNKLMY